MSTSWLIGRAEDCDLRVEAADVSSHHCRLSRSGDSFLLEDVGSTNGTFVNGERVDEPVAVTAADKILLAESVPMPWPEKNIPPTLPAKNRHPATVPAVAPSTREVTIGRDPDSDCALELSGVSWNHAKLVVDGDRGMLEDLGSANGTFVGSLKNRIERAEISRGDIVFLGTHRIAADDLLTAQAGKGGMDAMELDAERPVVLGRASSSDQVLDHPMVSWRHARISRDGDAYLVEDLDSTNGTFINGKRVEGSSPARAGDVVVLGSYSITLSEAGRMLTADNRGHLAIEARDLTVEVPGRRLLEDVSLTIRPGKFVGLMGLAGAGKSTLMNALNGYTPPTEGAVLIGGRNLYEHYDSFRGQIGYVPQDDIMHSDLTVREALYYTARLRLPSDFSGKEIRQRISEVLEQLGMKDAEDVLIGSPEKKGISGGQRKRVNLAMELLTDPSILFLDEPTSGLSSEDALIVMNLLGELARLGKTILLTIHQPSLEAYRQMDDLIIIAKDSGSTEPGRLGWFGPAYPEAIEFFNPDGIPGQRPGVEPSPDEVLRGLGRQPAAIWTKRYRESPFYEQYVGAGEGKVLLAEGPVEKEVRREFGVRQCWTLFQRGLTIRLRDRANTALLMAQAPIIAILIVMVFGGEVDGKIANPMQWASAANATAMTCFLLALSSLWCGCSNSVREIVGEWAIYRRERMVNLKIPSYIASKLGVLLGLSAIQCFILLGMVYRWSGLTGPFWYMYLVLLLVSAVGVGIGLAISALARSSEFAVAMLPIVILPMIMMGGALQPVEKMNAVVRLGSHVIPARWAFETLLLMEADKRDPRTPTEEELEIAAREGSAEFKTPDVAERFFARDDERTSTFAGTIVLIAMFWTCVVGVALLLRRRDIH